MNSSEKKFAVNRIFNLLATKQRELETEDSEETHRECIKGNVPLPLVIKGITEGSIKPRKNLKNSSANSSLASIYNIDVLKKQHANKLKLLTKLPDKESIRFKNPYASTNDYGNYYKFNYVTYHKRALKIIDKFQATVDEIMLGDNAKALSLIKSIEKMKF